jgi:hypothetical protein
MVRRLTLALLLALALIHAQHAVWAHGVDHALHEIGLADCADHERDVCLVFDAAADLYGDGFLVEAPHVTPAACAPEAASTSHTPRKFAPYASRAPPSLL